MKLFKDSKLILISFLIIINIILLLFTTSNLVSINNSNKSIIAYSSINSKNKDYLEKLTNILKASSTKNLSNLINITDNYVFDSSIEAITNREFFKKRGVIMPQYAITTELSTIGNIPEGEIGYIQLKYDMKNRNYSEFMAVINAIAKNERFDYISSLTASKIKGSNGKLNINLIYTNLGMILE